MDGLIDFITSLTLGQIIAYFWPYFMVDLTRYVLLEAAMVFRFKARRFANRKQRARLRTRLFRQRPLVSVIVPGKNEGKHIPNLVRSLATQTYQNFELIVVDDGSDDATPLICRRLEKQGKIHRFIRNEIRGGKASGANTALLFSRGKYIIHIDADSHLRSDSIEKLLLPFLEDDTIGAVGGDVRVANESDSFATRLQAIEYFKTISGGRVTTSELGILRIISGAHGAFRRDLLDQIEGWDVGPGLDGDITLKIRKLGYRVVHEVDAVCFTNVPLAFKKLVRQRYRWDKSVVRFRLRKHVDILFPQANFRESNFFSVLENLTFNLFLDLKWFIYLAYMSVSAPTYLGYVFVINYFLYFIGNVLQFWVVIFLVGRDQVNKELGLFLRLMPLYTAIFLRAVRTYAYVMELLYKTSYDDPWNPWKVSSIAKKNKL